MTRLRMGTVLLFALSWHHFYFSKPSCTIAFQCIFLYYLASFALTFSSFTIPLSISFFASVSFSLSPILLPSCNLTLFPSRVIPFLLFFF
ncbi:MAG: hypothetical protein JOS17DRAFT_764425, partial [Linnemannia elongata]